MQKIKSLIKTQRALEERASSLEKEIRSIKQEIGLPNIENIQFTIHDLFTKYDHSDFFIGVSDVTNVKNKELPHEQQFVKLFVIKDYQVHEETDFFIEQPYYEDLLSQVQDWAQMHIKEDESVLPQVDNMSKEDVEKKFNQEFQFGETIEQNREQG